MATGCVLGKYRICPFTVLQRIIVYIDSNISHQSYSSYTHFHPRSRKHIPPIDQNITPRHEARRLAPQVQIHPLNLLDMPLPPQRRHAIRLLQRQLARAHLGVEEARRDDVDARKLAPLPRERLAKVRDERLGRVVHGLVDGHVDNVRRHARRDDEVAVALRLEDCANVLGAEDDSVHCWGM